MTTADLTTALIRACLNRPRPRADNNASDVNAPGARIASAFTTTTALATRLNGGTR